MPISSAAVWNVSPPGSSSKPTSLQGNEGERQHRLIDGRSCASRRERAGHALHLGDAVDEPDHTGQHLDLELGDEKGHVGDVGLEEERVGVLGGEFLRGARSARARRRRRQRAGRTHLEMRVHDPASSKVAVVEVHDRALGFAAGEGSRISSRSHQEEGGGGRTPSSE